MMMMMMMMTMMMMTMMLVYDNDDDYDGDDDDDYDDEGGVDDRAWVGVRSCMKRTNTSGLEGLTVIQIQSYKYKHTDVYTNTNLRSRYKSMY